MFPGLMSISTSYINHSFIVFPVLILKFHHSSQIESCMMQVIAAIFFDNTENWKFLKILGYIILITTGKKPHSSIIFCKTVPGKNIIQFWQDLTPNLQNSTVIFSTFAIF